MRKFALTLLAVAVFGAGLMFAGLPKSGAKIIKPEFVPGQRVVIHIGNSTIEGIVEEVNRAAKGDRLVRADGEPMEEHLFHHDDGHGPLPPATIFVQRPPGVVDAVMIPSLKP